MSNIGLHSVFELSPKSLRALIDLAEVMGEEVHKLEYSNSGEKKVRFDSILATESIFSIRFYSAI